MTTFALRIRPSVQAELDAAAFAETQGKFYTAFLHLERAHVLGQAATVEHVRVHWRMFRFALRNRLAGEAFGQTWRIMAASVFTALGLVPAGNTGGSDVSALRRMKMPRDLQDVVDSARLATRGGDACAVRRVLATSAFAMLAALGTLGMGGCSTPKDLDVALDKPSAGGTYRVALVPPAQAAAINQMHSWKVKLATADGTPVHGATFAVGGGMPQHGHGLPTQPRVTPEVADGTYQLDGMKFSMPGWWEVKLDIQGPQGTDKVTFNTIVNDPLVRQ
jgi:hypothetical protein